MEPDLTMDPSLDDVMVDDLAMGEPEPVAEQTPVAPEPAAPERVRFMGGEYENLTTAELEVRRALEQAAYENQMLQNQLRQNQQPPQPKESQPDPSRQLAVEKTLQEIDTAIRSGQGEQAIRKLVETALSPKEAVLPEQLMNFLGELHEDFQSRKQERYQTTMQHKWQETFKDDPEFAEYAPAAALLVAQPTPENIKAALRAIQLRERERHTQKKVVRGAFGTTGEAPDSSGNPWGGKDENKMANDQADKLTRSWGW